MTDYQTTANGIGATLRAAENAADLESATETKIHLASLHALLGDAYHQANAVLAAAGMAPLNWSGIVGGASRADEPSTESGGGGKDEPTPPPNN